MRNYRGKRIYDGEWVYGWYRREYDDHIIQPNCEDGESDYIGYPVDPETVGQYTGLKDKNGVEIYEGDTCQLGTTMYQIVWNDGYAKYGAKVISTETVLARGCTFQMKEYITFSSGLCRFEVIGNIHKNEGE